MLSVPVRYILPLEGEIVSRRTPYIEPLPAHKLIAVVFFAAAGIGLFTIGVLGYSDHEGLWTITIRGLGITLMTVALLDLGPEVIRFLRERRDRRKFVEFFGSHALKKGMVLIVGGRKIELAALHHLQPFPATSGYTDSGGNCVPTDVNLWLAEDDIRGASYLAQTLAVQGVDVTIRAASGHEPSLNEFSSTAFGLGFNIHTEVLWKATNGLFSAAYEQDPNEDSISDHIVIEDERIVDTPTRKSSHAIIARIVPDDSSGQVHFVAAGETALGTAVAGNFLAKHWLELYRMYRSPDDLHSGSRVFLLSHPLPKAEERSDMALHTTILGELDRRGRLQPNSFPESDNLT